MAASGRHDLRRWAAPVAFLAALTIAVVLVHDALDSRGGGSPAAPPAATVTAAAIRPKTKPRRASTTGASTATTGASYYTVQSGDTYGSIAAREGTTVAQLEQLNPAVSANALRVGQQIRVK